ncbi:MAG TPA: choice-of-anchor tandem repeat GloVer-containing protein [Terriglobales bacterium]|nr:choice-of-anchor tandem repeat GloVer-containing protein [Terriglobales bacterium]
MVLFFASAILAKQPVQAQTFSVLHYFTGGSDGANPIAGVTLGASGTLYGTTYQGGTSGEGVVFKLTQRGSGWTLSPLHEFAEPDGAFPLAGVAIGPEGSLYGTTSGGGAAQYGTVFKLTPPARVCRATNCYWNETILHNFQGRPHDGAGPGYGSVVFDGAGNIYGTTQSGNGTGNEDCGTVWELAVPGGMFTESVIYTFTSSTDGCRPAAGVIFDTAGNLYGSTQGNGPSNASVYELSPLNGSWMESTLGEQPQHIAPSYNSLIIDQSGDLYGTGNGFNGGEPGGVYKVNPQHGLSVVFVFQVGACRPFAGVTLGPDGNLYGVCQDGGAFGYGWVFEMPPNCNQTCTPNDLHDFDGSDGRYPDGNVVFDASGNLYGTTYGGGQIGNACSEYGCGVVWEMMGVAGAPGH